MKQHKFLWMLGLMGLAVAVLLLSGCAAGTTGVSAQDSGQNRMESLLIQAGFEIFPESHPECQRVCQKIPPEQFVPHKKDDKTVYTYFSPGSKHLYVGDEAAYQLFINLAVLKGPEPTKPSCGCAE